MNGTLPIGLVVRRWRDREHPKILAEVGTLPALSLMFVKYGSSPPNKKNSAGRLWKSFPCMLIVARSVKRRGLAPGPGTDRLQAYVPLNVIPYSKRIRCVTLAFAPVPPMS